MLLVKVISTPYPPRNEPPENVICGPGLLLQSYAEKSAEMATGMGRAVLLMCGNDDADAENDGAVSARLDDRSVHAPARTTAPSRTSDFASATLAHMLASLSKKGLQPRSSVSPVRGARKAGWFEGRAPGDSGGWQGVYL